MTSKLKSFSLSSARPLPVILLADVSGSMAAEGKIDALNSSVAEMLQAFSEEDEGLASIHVAIVTFGGTAQLHTPLTLASELEWTPMQANSVTPLGDALTLARELIEDKSKLPSRAYRPTVVLVSDGIPTDDWRGPLEAFLASERASKAQRFALGIGSDADPEVLRAFLNEPEGRIFGAHEARQIRSFFQWLTMTVTTRSRSVMPNSVISLTPPDDLDDYGDF